MKSLPAIDIRSKLAALVALAIVALAASTLAALGFLYSQMRAERIAKVRATVEMVRTLAEDFEARAARGETTRETAIARFRDAARSMWFDNRSEYVFVWTLDGTSLVHAARPQLENQRLIDLKDSTGKPLIRDLIALAKAGGGVYEYLWPKAGHEEPIRKISVVQPFAPWDIFIGAGLYADEMEAEFKSIALALLAWIAGFAAAIGLAAWLISRSIRKPLAALEAKLAALADGDIQTPVELARRNDETGRMAKAVETLRLGLAAAAAARAEQEAAKAQAEAARRAQLLAVAERFEAEVGTLVAAVAEAAQTMRATCDSMSGTAQSTRADSAQVVGATERTSANVQTVAAATEELTASIREIVRQTDGARQRADSAVALVATTDGLVQSLAAAGDKIGGVLALIGTIASQTNLLALNATIEAARAGEAGRGFAVVASEVKGLASQSAAAAQDIAQEIAAMQSATRAAVDAISGIRNSIADVSENSSSIAAAVRQQEAATQEIVRNVQQAATGIQDVADAIGGVNAAVAATSDATASGLSTAGDLASKADALRGKVATFLETLRAA